MKWIKILTEETYYGSTFQELTVIERGVWFSLLVMAGLPPSEGVVLLRQNCGYELSTLAKLLQIDPRTLQKCMRKLISSGKIVIDKHKIIHITNWKKYQTDYARYRQRDYVKSKEELSRRRLSKKLPTTTHTDTNKNKDKNKNEESEKNKNLPIRQEHEDKENRGGIPRSIKKILTEKGLLE